MRRRWSCSWRSTTSGTPSCSAPRSSDLRITRLYRAIVAANDQRRIADCARRLTGIARLTQLRAESSMSFPISITGTISLPKETGHLRSVEELCGQVEKLLESARATTITRQGGSVVFTAGLFRTVTSWNVLVAINYGKIIIEDAGSVLRISYFASTIQMLII